MATIFNENRKRELKAFDDMKTGVKGLVDIGIIEIPQIFISNPKSNPMLKVSEKLENLDYSIPVIDLQGILQGDESSRPLMAPHPPEPEELPQICRNEITEYSSRVMTLGYILLELMSTSLGLKSDHLNSKACGEGVVTMGHYYPKCPQPHLTLGASKHTDTDFLTILLQDQVSGLQVLHQDKWIDVPPVHGALVVNLGDLMQLITNDKFKSVSHRVLARDTGPRVSIACFLRPQMGTADDSRIYGPMKEILFEGEAPIYKDITIHEFDAHHFSKGIDGVSAIEHFKL